MTQSGAGRAVPPDVAPAAGACVGAILASLLVPASVSAASGEPMRLAYVDPGAGSLLLQAVLATLAGVVVAVHTWWKKIRAALGLPVAEDHEEKSTVAPDDD